MQDNQISEEFLVKKIDPNRIISDEIKDNEIYIPE